MAIGDRIRKTIYAAIGRLDKLLIILSHNSIASEWVEGEVERAFERERRQKETILFPIRLDDDVMATDEAWAGDIRRTRHIGDFTRWNEAEAYARALRRLLRDLQVDRDNQPAPPRPAWDLVPAPALHTVRTPDAEAAAAGAIHGTQGGGGWLLAELQPGRRVTLCGPGGMGKTALASEAIWRLAPGDVPPERFPDGVLWHSFYGQPQRGAGAGGRWRGHMGRRSSRTRARPRGERWQAAVRWWCWTARRRRITWTRCWR